MNVTGERVTTREGGFNPTWQRHVAAYGFCATVLGPGSVVDLGCGVGHSYRLLAPRKTVGVDHDQAALAGQERQTVHGDIRRLPFADASFDGAVSVHSVEHVPDPARVVAEAVRVLRPGGVAVFVTPNRLTFGRPDEIIDPYHYVEFDEAQFETLCSRRFAAVRMLGLFGSARLLDLLAAERRRLDSLLRLDPLRLRRWLPRRARQRLYDWRLRRERAGDHPLAQAIEPEDFSVGDDGLEQALDLIAVCEKGAAPPA